MKKMTLDLDALQVDSFDTDDAASARGTVRGAESVLIPAPEDGTLGGGESGKTCITCNRPTDPCLCDPIYP